MAEVRLSKIEKRFGNHIVIPELDLTIQSGEFMVLVGPSGCGKSTLLRIIAGLETPTGGTLEIEGQNALPKSPKDRGIAMVFQNYALYPHMTVRENLSFGLKLSKTPPEEVSKRIQEAAEVLGLGELLDRKPSQLSGGQKQRVAMGRAMVRNPKVFLFDEPLSNLDAQLRVKMRSEIAKLHRRLGCTVVYVTHDQVEAMTLATRIAVLSKGKIEQVGTPMELYQRPATRFVASFIGTPSMNFLPTSVIGRKQIDGNTTFGFRPEFTFLQSPTQDPVKLGKARITLVESMGTMALVHADLEKHPISIEMKTEAAPHIDDWVELFSSERHLHFFDSSGHALR